MELIENRYLRAPTYGARRMKGYLEKGIMDSNSILKE